jgi:hypothetical protein
MTSANLLGEPPETLLPTDPAAEKLTGGSPAADVAREHPTSSLAWAVLAEQALAAGAEVEAYAYARTGYHRALDSLRRNGWKGHGPVPWRHGPNQGFLRALAALARAAEAIEETDEAHRCREFLYESSREAFDQLLGKG